MVKIRTGIWLNASRPNLTKVTVQHDRAERKSRLFQYLFTMYDEQQTCIPAFFLNTPPIKVFEIKSRDSRFTCTCCCNNQILIAVDNLTLILQFLQHLNLMSLSLKTHNELRFRKIWRFFMSFFPNGILEPLQCILVVNRLEVITAPIVLKSSLRLIDNMRILHRSNAHVPFQSFR